MQLINMRRVLLFSSSKYVATMYLVLLLSIISLSLLSNTNEQRVISRGDFPAFYAAGVLYRQSSSELYNPQAQAIVQQHYWSSYGEQYHYFAYPPLVAAVVSPLSELQPGTAKFVWVVLQICLLGAAIYMLMFRESRTEALLYRQSVLSFGFLPILIGTLGGQNVATTLFLVAAICMLVDDIAKHTCKLFLAGLVLGFWTYKPHFAASTLLLLLPFLGVYFFMGFLVSVILLVSATNYLFGSGWFWNWSRAVSFFKLQESEANLDALIGFPSVLEQIAKMLEVFTPEQVSMTNTISAAMLLCVAMAFAYVRKKDLLSRGRKFLVLASTSLAVLISPHAMYYELGIFALLVIFLTARRSYRESELLLIFFVYWMVNILLAWRPSLFGAVLMCLAWIIWFVSYYRIQRIQTQSTISPYSTVGE